MNSNRTGLACELGNKQFSYMDRTSPVLTFMVLVAAMIRACEVLHFSNCSHWRCISLLFRSSFVGRNCVIGRIWDSACAVIYHEYSVLRLEKIMHIARLK